MSQNISDEHLNKILQAMEMKSAIDEKRKLSEFNKESILKLKDTTLEAYSEYKNFKSKISLAMELVDLFKE